MKKKRKGNVFVFLVLLSVFCMPVSGGLIAHYTLDETSGNTANDSVSDPNYYHGLLNDNGFDTGSTTGLIGNALMFNGSSDFIQLERVTSQATPPPAEQVPALGLEQFTLAAWFNKTGTGFIGTTGGGGVTGIPIIAKGTGEGDGSSMDMNYWMGIDTDSDVIAADFESTDSSYNNHPLRGTTVIGDNTWYHIALTYNGTAMILYLNRFEDARLETSDTPRNDSIQPAAIGGALYSIFRSGKLYAQLFEGMIDDARIYDNALADSEILTLFSDVVQEYCTEYPTADITGPNGEPDCRVDLYDLSLLASQWLQDNMVSTK